jgi:GNAT superfamily N-acetyltransferase
MIETRRATLAAVDEIMTVQIMSQAGYVGTATDKGGDELYGGGVSLPYGIQGSTLLDYVTDTQPGGYYDRHSNHWASIIEQSGQDSRTGVTVATRGEQILGAIATVAIIEDGEEATEALKLFVSPQGMGIGSLLVATAVNATSEGEPLYVVTSKTGPALRFYLNRGFRPAKNQPTEVPTLAGRYYHEQIRLVRRSTASDFL